MKYPRYVPSSYRDIAREPHDARERLWFGRLLRLSRALTARQVDVLYALARGITSDAEIARALFISVQQTKNHLTAAYRALGVRGVYGSRRPQAAALAYGLLLRARALVGGEDAVVDGRHAGGAAGAGAAGLGDVGADGALWAAGVPPADGRMGAGGEST